MMTTAIALFGTRISPRFDCAQEFMLITTSDSAVTDQHTETIKEQLSIGKARRLADLKVDTLICGGIDESSRQHLNAYGINIVANRRGRVDDIVNHYLTALTPAPIHSAAA
jgi:predicted Fe-Mo cluster-binding NifX family protein